MSISEENLYKVIKSPPELARTNRITFQLLSLFSDPRLKGKITIPALNLHTIEIIFISFKETLRVTFSQDYPNSPPTFSRDKSLFESLIMQSNSLQTWSSSSQLVDVVSDVYQNMKIFTQNQNKSEKNMSSLEIIGQFAKRDSKQSSEEAVKRKVMMNGCADNELTQTKNLNRHFRSKLREVYFDVFKEGYQPPQDAKWIEGSFTLPRVGFEDIAKVLKNEWFNAEVDKQMENGKFMHKIMKGMMSIKSKKLMVKYYHVMLAAVKDPENFVKWKYQ